MGLFSVVEQKVVARHPAQDHTFEPVQVVETIAGGFPHRGQQRLSRILAHQPKQLAQGNAKDGNVTEARGMVGIDARNNYVYSPEKFVAIVGVDDLVVVETEDAILITTRERSQDVRRVVSELTGKHDELI